MRVSIAVMILLPAMGWRPHLEQHMARRNAIVGAASLLSTLPRACNAASKYDKDFDNCLSKCVYEKTKITKGIAQVEVISRAEAFAECKPKCAKSKEQLMIGQPKK